MRTVWAIVGSLEVFIWIISFLHFCSAQTECIDLEHICDDLTVGDSVEDPYNCHNYYFCVNDTSCPEPLSISDIFTCPEGQYYDIDSALCVKETIIPCTSTCDTYTCAKYCNSGPSCHTQFIPDPNDCGLYLQCGIAGPIQRQCPEDTPYFDGFKCSSNEASCCAELCDAYCTEDDEFKFVEDPNDCTAYYFCLEVGTPTNHNHCDPGEVYDPDKRVCVEGDSCESYCGPDVTPTTTKSTVTPTTTENTPTTTESTFPLAYRIFRYLTT